MTYSLVSIWHNNVWLVCNSNGQNSNDAFLFAYLLSIYHNTSSPYVRYVICYTWESTTARWSRLITNFDPFVQVPVHKNQITIEFAFEPCIGSSSRATTAGRLLLSNYFIFLFEDLQEDLIHDLLQVWFSQYVLMASLEIDETFEFYTNRRHGLWTGFAVNGSFSCLQSFEVTNLILIVEWILSNPFS